MRNEIINLASRFGWDEVWAHPTLGTKTMGTSPFLGAPWC